jgi:hypothetical protein
MTNILILLREIIAVHAENNMKHIKHPVDKIQRSFNGTADGTRRFHWVLENRQWSYS